MRTVLELGLDDLTAVRFAMSPLHETVTALQLLGRNRRPVPLQSWLTHARRTLRESQLTLPTAWPLLHTGRRGSPEFIVPAPAQLTPSIDDELAHMCRTKPDHVRASLRRIFGHDLPAPAAALAAQPAATLQQIADELRAAHDLLIAPLWPRLRPLLAADIAYRADKLANIGLGQMIAGLHRDLSWSDDKLVIKGQLQGDRLAVEDGLVLVPTALNADEIRLKLRSSTQTVLRYPARGIADLWTTVTPPPPGLNRLIGAPRARLLAILRTPAGTQQLATELDVTPSAVSQHLNVLRQNGLIDTIRTGRTATHQLTATGRALLVPSTTH